MSEVYSALTLSTALSNCEERGLSSPFSISSCPVYVAVRKRGDILSGRPTSLTV